MSRSRLQRARTLAFDYNDSLDEMRIAITNMTNTVAEQSQKISEQSEDRGVAGSDSS